MRIPFIGVSNTAKANVILHKNISENIIAIVKEQFMRDDVDENTSFEELNADSLDMLELTIPIEHIYSVHIDESKLYNINTVNDLIKLTKKHL